MLKKEFDFDFFQNKKNTQKWNGTFGICMTIFLVFTLAISLYYIKNPVSKQYSNSISIINNASIFPEKLREKLNSNIMQNDTNLVIANPSYQKELVEYYKKIQKADINIKVDMIHVKLDKSNVYGIPAGNMMNGIIQDNHVVINLPSNNTNDLILLQRLENKQ